MCLGRTEHKQFYAIFKLRHKGSGGKYIYRTFYTHVLHVYTFIYLRHSIFTLFVISIPCNQDIEHFYRSQKLPSVSPHLVSPHPPALIPGAIVLLSA